MVSCGGDQSVNFGGTPDSGIYCCASFYFHPVVLSSFSSTTYMNVYETRSYFFGSLAWPVQQHHAWSCFHRQLGATVPLKPIESARTCLCFWAPLMHAVFWVSTCELRLSTRFEIVSHACRIVHYLAWTLNNGSAIRNCARLISFHTILLGIFFVAW